MVDSFDPEVNYSNMAILIIVVDSSDPKVNYSSMVILI